MESNKPTHIARFLDAEGQTHYGELDQDHKTAEVLQGSLFDGTLERTGKRVDVASLLPPVKPEAIFCIGQNYMKHWEEIAKKSGIPVPERPVIFMKQNSSVIAHGGDIIMPDLEHGEQLDWEVELTMVIGKACKNATKENALSYVCGYTVGNDVTSRHWQKKSGASQWIKGKSFDTFCPLGPVIATTAAIPDPQKL